MEPLTPPPKIARPQDSGGGGFGEGFWIMLGSNGSNGGSGPGSPPPVGLSLELGCSGSGTHSHKPTTTTKTGSLPSYGFTMLQLQELQLQSLIYKHIEAGLQVPPNLLFPIWKTIAGSIVGPNIGSMFTLHPTFTGCSPLFMEGWNVTFDPEPGRCRRTDGKKWRCSKEALHDHKYCERHVHRGRQLRSRKLVEAAAAAAAASTNLSISLSSTGGNSNSNSDSSSSANNNPSASCGFSPKSVLHHGVGQKN